MRMKQLVPVEVAIEITSCKTFGTRDKNEMAYFG